MRKGIFRAVAAGLAVFTLNSGPAFAQFVDPWPCNSCTYSKSFPGTCGVSTIPMQQVDTTIKLGEHHYYSFTAGSSGFVEWTTNTTTTASQKTFWISTSPDPAPGTAISGCIQTGSTGRLGYGTGSMTSACKLTEGQSYYLNVRSIAGTPFSSTWTETCPTGKICGYKWNGAALHDGDCGSYGALRCDDPGMGTGVWNPRPDLQVMEWTSGSKRSFFYGCTELGVSGMYDDCRNEGTFEYGKTYSVRIPSLDTGGLGWFQFEPVPGSATTGFAVSLSKEPGVFNNLPENCSVENKPLIVSPIGGGKIGGLDTSACEVQSGEYYYLNFKVLNPSCGNGSICRYQIINHLQEYLDNGHYPSVRPDCR